MNANNSFLAEFEQLLPQQNTAALIRWLESAPVEHLPVFYNALAAHIFRTNAQLNNTDRIHQQAEKFRPVMNYAIAQLIQLYQQQGEMLSRHNEAIASACKKLLKVQYQAYALIFDHARQHTEKKGLLAISIHRIMTIQLYLHIIGYIMYNAMADKEWLNLHRLFIIAERNDLTDFAVHDEAGYIKKSVSINDLYSYSLLMGCASLHTLNVASIIKTFHFVFERANLVLINDQPLGSDNEIVVDISTGMAPNFRKFYDETEQSIFRYIHFEKLLSSMEKQKIDDAVFNQTSLTEELKTHLIQAWSKYYVREERTVTNKTIEATLGFNNIHYYLCGGRNLEDFLGERIHLAIMYEEDELISLIEQQRSSDVWAPGLSAPVGKLLHDELPEAFSFQRYFEMEKNINTADHPRLIIKMIDHSIHGCCLELPKEQLFNIIIGDLIGFHDANLSSNWQVGEITWCKIFEEKVIHVGVRLLST